MTKKNTSMWLEASVQRRLRILSAEYGIPVGDVIERLLDFSDKWGTVPDTNFQRTFKGLFEKTMGAKKALRADEDALRPFIPADLLSDVKDEE